MGLERKRGLIIGLDMMDYRKFVSAADSIASINSDIVFKIGNCPVDNNTFGKVVGCLKLFDNPIIYDAKLAEAPEYAKKSIKESIEQRLDGIIVHGFLGNAVKDFVEMSKGTETDIIVIADMSYENKHYERIAKEVTEFSVKCGAKGIVAPANKLEELKEIRRIVDGINPSAYIASPGASEYQGGSPQKALESGADYLIFSDSITEFGIEKKVKELLNLF